MTATKELHNLKATISIKLPKNNFRRPAKLISVNNQCLTIIPYLVVHGTYVINCKPIEAYFFEEIANTHMRISTRVCHSIAQ